MLVTAVRPEPVSLASKPLRATGSAADYTVRLFNAELALRDARDVARPYLAETLPQLNTDSWGVFPEGRMETVYRLRPSLSWHDGEPITAADFVFAWQVYADPDFGQGSATPQNLMDDVASPDARTLVIRWRGLYPNAGELSYSLFQPLPRHLLGAAYRQGDTEALVNHSFWSSQYVGAGPYQLEQWEPGAFIVARAFQGHALGRPKIDRVTIRFFTDENTALTNMLAGSAQLATDRALRYEHVETLKRHWIGAQQGVVTLTPTQWRYVWVQMRPTVVEPRALLDVRVRQALAHTIDKDGLNALLGDEEALADTLLPRTVPYFAELDRAIAKYPYDLRRSEQLMAEVGYARGPDGLYANASGERFHFDLWGDAGTQLEKDLAVLGDGWRRVGYEPRQFVVSVAQLRDKQFRTTFKGLYSTTSGAAADHRLDHFVGASIPTAENRWTGNNYAGWANGEFDRLWDEFSTTLDRAERNRQVIQMMTITSQDLAIIPLYHNFEVAAHVAALQGPDPRPVAFNLINWNVHEWELRI
jgi:peptide/nickel transport system substrate-binding protein